MNGPLRRMKAPMNKRFIFRSALALSLTAAVLGCSPKTTPSATSATPAATAGQASPTLSPDVAAQLTSTPSPSASASASVTPALDSNAATTPTPGASPQASTGSIPEVAGVKITVVKPGAGAPLQAGTSANFHYTGWLDSFNGQKMFDSSRERGPFSFVVGQGQVIQGWDKGLIGMQPGEIRHLEISPEMGYGKDGAGATIPPDSTLFFEVEYLGPLTKT